MKATTQPNRLRLGMFEDPAVDTCMASYSVLDANLRLTQTVMYRSADLDSLNMSYSAGALHTSCIASYFPIPDLNDESSSRSALSFQKIGFLVKHRLRPQGHDKYSLGLC